METAVASSRVELRVRYSETDQMGIVYHANYLPWCEVGRTELIRQLWKPYAEIERDGYRLAVTDVALRYHRSARYDDLIRVETHLEEVRSRSVTFGYRVLRVDSGAETTLLVSATTKLVSVDPRGGPAKLPTALVQAFRTELESR